MTIAPLRYRGMMLCTVMLLAACTNGPPPPPVTTAATFSSMPNAPTISERALMPDYNGCARAEEMRAAKAATIKQKLMVAGLTCEAADSYNDFVRGYQDELQSSDFDLQNFFVRMHGADGDRALDSFKTRIANVSMMDSLADAGSYCTNARASFDAAKANRGRSLAVFIAGQETDPRADFSPCAVETASSLR